MGVSDGDTLTVLDESKVQHKLRLEGIDAPESHQAYGTRSKQELSKRVYLKSVRVAVTGTDKYGRELGHVYVGDRWVNRELVEGGYAWHYKEYSSDGDLSRAEDYARQSKAGLWSMPNPVPPWDFRHDPTKAATAMVVSEPSAASPRFAVAIDSDAGGATVYVTKSGSKYHSAGCRHLSKSAIPISLEEAKRRYSACSVCGS